MLSNRQTLRMESSAVLVAYMTAPDAFVAATFEINRSDGLRANVK